jgi:8-oxo-dGTP diphosphatase
VRLTWHRKEPSVVHAGSGSEISNTAGPDVDPFATARVTAVRHVHFHDPAAPPATAVVPSVFVAVRDQHDRVLLVRRRDSGVWELPGGRVDVGECVVDAAVRETSEEAGVRVQVDGLVGVFSDPGHVVRSVSGEVRQQFVVCVRARPVWGRPRPDLEETIDAAWFEPSAVDTLALEPGAERWIRRALADAPESHLE